MKLRLTVILLILCILAPTGYSQNNRRRALRVKPIVKEAPAYVDSLEGITVTAQRKKKKGKEWRQYYKLVHNFSKVYPYALVAKEIMLEADSSITTGNLTRSQRNRYIKALQDELFDKFEDVIRDMTVKQGQILLRLIDRETGITPYEIIETYKNKAAASFWQVIASMFGSDMKAPYNPEGDDIHVEKLVQLYQKGEFRKLYFDIFGKNPPEPVIRPKNDFPQQ